MREIRPYGSVRGVRRKPYPYRDSLHPVQSTVSTSPQTYMEVHTFNARTVSVDSTPAWPNTCGYGAPADVLNKVFQIFTRSTPTPML
jgi:hypothetical protein